MTDFHGRRARLKCPFLEGWTSKNKSTDALSLRRQSDLFPSHLSGGRHLLSLSFFFPSEIGSLIDVRLSWSWAEEIWKKFSFDESYGILMFQFTDIFFDLRFDYKFQLTIIFFDKKGKNEDGNCKIPVYKHASLVLYCWRGSIEWSLISNILQKLAALTCISTRLIPCDRDISCL